MMSVELRAKQQVPNKHYNIEEFPHFVVKHGNWDIRRNESGYCAAIPNEDGVAAGCNATHFGDMAYVRYMRLI